MIYTNENWKPPVTYCEPNEVEVQRMNKQEAIKVLSSYDVNGVWADVDGKPYNAKEQAEAFDMAIEALQAEPVKHGEWIHEGVDYMTGLECWSRLPRFCSECKQETRAYFYNYCSNCGAKMDKD